MLFTPHLVTLNNLGAQSSLRKPKLWGPKICVVPRSDCTFRRLAVKGKGRPAILAAKLQIKHEAASDNTEVIIVRDPKGPGASAWLFSVHPGFKGAYIPESLTLSPMEEGARVVAGLKGFEGQSWSNHVLTSSRWWPRPPSQRDLDLFFRASNVSDIQPLSTSFDPQTVPINPNAAFWWASKDDFLRLASPKRFLWASGVCGMIVGLFFGGQYLRASHLLAQANDEIAQVSETAQLILSQRRKALKNIQSVKNIQSLGDEALILSALYGLTSSLSKQGLLMTSFSVAENRLEVALSGRTDLSSPEIVTRLESVPSLVDATVALDLRGNFTVKAVLVPFKTKETVRLIP